MKKEKILINKNNYEGYTKLYETYFFDKKDETRIHKIILGNVLMGGVGAFGLFFSPIPLLFGMVIPLSIGMTVGSVFDIILEKQDQLKKKYPYLDYTVSKQELEDCLKAVEIVTIDSHGYPKIDVEVFENKMQKYEEEKEKYLEEQKRSWPSLKWTTENVKVKQLVKTRRK